MAGLLYEVNCSYSTCSQLDRSEMRKTALHQSKKMLGAIAACVILTTTHTPEKTVLHRSKNMLGAIAACVILTTTHTPRLAIHVAHFILVKGTHKHTHTHTRTQTHAHVHTQTHNYTHTTHTHTHTHTHTGADTLRMRIAAGVSERMTGSTCTGCPMRRALRAAMLRIAAALRSAGAPAWRLKIGECCLALCASKQVSAVWLSVPKNR